MTIPVRRGSPLVNSLIDPSHTKELQAVHDCAFQLLAHGCEDPKSPLHTPVLATVGLDGAAQCRTVVLRGFDPARRLMTVYTDYRSPKVAEIERDARISLVFFEGVSKVQLRIFGIAALHRGDATAEQAWSRLEMFGRRCYLGAAPGAPSQEPSAGLPPDLLGIAPDAARSAIGFQNFTVIEIRMEKLDWLYLSPSGDRRARLTWDARGAFAADWLTP